MTTLTKETLDELRALLAKATPGKWTASLGSQASEHLSAWSPVRSAIFVGGELIVSVLGDRMGREHANTSLIAAAVNALPGLLALAERAMQPHGMLEAEHRIAALEAEVRSAKPGKEGA